MIYKYADYLQPPVMNTLYVHNRDVHSHVTRQKHLLHISKSNINVYANTSSNTSALEWNVQQTEMNTSTSISSFKTYSNNTYQIIHSL